MDNFHHKQNKAKLHVLAALMHMLGCVINESGSGDLEVHSMMVPVITNYIWLTVEQFLVFSFFFNYYSMSTRYFPQLNCRPLDIFFFWYVNFRDACDVVKIPVDLQFVKHSNLQPFWHQQPHSKLVESSSF